MKKTTRETIKTALLVVFIAAATIDFIFIVGEPSDNLTIAAIAALKAGAFAAAYILYKAGKAMHQHGMIPEWLSKTTAQLLAED